MTIKVEAISKFRLTNRVAKIDYDWIAVLSMTIIQIVVPMAATPATAAAIARTVSTGLAAATTTGAMATRPAAGAGRAAGCAAAAAAAGATGAAVVVRWAATGAAVPAGGRATAGAAPGIPPGAPVGPPGGNVGNLIVGAADGFGGKVMRTVSFLGWTLPVDFFMGVTGAPGTPGGIGGCGLSAIVFQIKIKPARNLSNQFRKEFRIAIWFTLEAGVPDWIPAAGDSVGALLRLPYTISGLAESKTRASDVNRRPATK